MRFIHNNKYNKELEKEVFKILKDKFHTDKTEKKKLLDEQKELYDRNDQLLKKKRIKACNEAKLNPWN